MASYLQLGHDSWNLLDSNELGNYVGIVLSPVNDDPQAVITRLARLGERRPAFEVILDSQLYNPSIDKGALGAWSYFPDDFETANRGDLSWWSSRSSQILDAAEEVGADAVCSPAFIPRKFTDDYYQFIVNIADQMKSLATHTNKEVLLTAIVSMADLGDPNRAQAIASILSSTDCDRLYLFFLDDTPPKEAYKDADALPTAIHLVKLLSNVMRVHIAFSSHDLVLWKFAGAADISSGKFLNLRRFSPARWQDEAAKGRQVSYWNENFLLTLLRDADVITLDREGWYGFDTFDDNPFSKQILDVLLSKSGAPWQALSWRQFLRWMSNTEAHLTAPGAAENFLIKSDTQWRKIEEMRVLFSDRPNDGSWVRIWLNACRLGGRR